MGSWEQILKGSLEGLRNWLFHASGYIHVRLLATQDISSSLAVHLGILPMMLWASALLRNSSRPKYLDSKFSLLILTQ